MDFDLRCLTWEGDWSPDMVTVAAERGRRGVYGKIVLTVCGEVGQPLLHLTYLTVILIYIV